jgi:hypothetical protein
MLDSVPAFVTLSAIEYDLSVHTASMDAGMARRTIYLPDSVEALARRQAREGESFSATVARLIEEGARAADGPRVPSYVGSGEGPGDLARDAERYLRRIFADPDFGH